MINITKNKRSANKKQIRTFIQTVTKNLENSKAVPVLLPCNLPDLLSTPFHTLMSCIQEYSRVRSY